MKRYLPQAVLGVAFGFALSWIGFSDWGQLHQMLTFADLRLVLVFGGAVLINGLAFAFIKDSRQLAPRLITPGTLPGAVLFGLGWAVTGACPSVSLVQLGEGQLLAVFTLAGVVLGSAIYPKVHARFFKWDLSSCEN